MTAQPCKTYLRLYAKGDRVFFFDRYHWQSPDKMKLATAITSQCGNELSILVDGEEDFGPQWGLRPGRRVKVSDIYDIYDDAADDNLIEEANEIEVKTTPENTVQTMPSGLLTRRQFLISIFAPAIAKPATKSPLPGVRKPEFWFGEKVEFQWIDEISGKSHFECGEIVGATWNSPEAQWEYAVTWPRYRRVGRKSTDG